MKPTRLCAIVLFAMLALAALPVLALAAERVKDGSYSGSVGPGYPLSFKVTAHGTEVEDLMLGLDVGCNGAPADVAPLYHFGTLKLKDGKLSGSTSRAFGPTVTDAVHISGEFKGDDVSGKVTADQSITSLGSCTEADTFTAKLK
jgi:hypothetical protein